MMVDGISTWETVHITTSNDASLARNQSRGLVRSRQEAPCGQILFICTVAILLKLAVVSSFSLSRRLGVYLKFVLIALDRSSSRQYGDELAAVAMSCRKS